MIRPACAFLILVTAACSKPAQPSGVDLKRVNADCKAGLRSGADCVRAGSAVTTRQTRDAESAFRNMGRAH